MRKDGSRGLIFRVSVTLRRSLSRGERQADRIGSEDRDAAIHDGTRWD
jgi:hypothetical protein